MKRINPSAMFMAMVFVGLCAAGLAWAQSQEPYEIYENSGKLTEVNPEYDTVVVEIPVNGKQKTVAGSVVPNANLTKDDQRAELNDFDVDNTVTVKWMVTDKGHNILELHQK